ncbi:MAG TPA: hypothetical protein VFY21_06870, partial [Xanthobacteraceae bacterium]|nr:hypothetical protein [Xanthobacteraceae bacterium]
MRLASASILLLLAGTLAAQTQEFRSYVASKSGTSAQVPANWRSEGMKAADTREGQIFVSPSGNSMLAIYTMSTTTRDRAQAADEPAAPDERITYRANGRNWFVRSGFKGDDRIFYRKVIFACDGRVAHLLAFDYPASEKR